MDSTPSPPPSRSSRYLAMEHDKLRQRASLLGAQVERDLAAVRDELSATLARSHDELQAAVRAAETWADGAVATDHPATRTRRNGVGTDDSTDDAGASSLLIAELDRWSRDEEALAVLLLSRAAQPPTTVGDAGHGLCDTNAEHANQPALADPLAAVAGVGDGVDSVYASSASSSSSSSAPSFADDQQREIQTLERAIAAAELRRIQARCALDAAHACEAELGKFEHSDITATGAPLASAEVQQARAADAKARVTVAIYGTSAPRGAGCRASAPPASPSASGASLSHSGAQMSAADACDSSARARVAPVLRDLLLSQTAVHRRRRDELEEILKLARRQHVRHELVESQIELMQDNRRRVMGRLGAMSLALSTAEDAIEAPLPECFGDHLLSPRWRRQPRETQEATDAATRGGGGSGVGRGNGGGGDGGGGEGDGGGGAEEDAEEGDVRGDEGVYRCVAGGGIGGLGADFIDLGIGDRFRRFRMRWCRLEERLDALLHGGGDEGDENDVGAAQRQRSAVNGDDVGRGAARGGTDGGEGERKSHSDSSVLSWTQLTAGRGGAMALREVGETTQRFNSDVSDAVHRQHALRKEISQTKALAQSIWIPFFLGNVPELRSAGRVWASGGQGDGAATAATAAMPGAGQRRPN